MCSGPRPSIAPGPRSASRSAALANKGRGGPINERSTYQRNESGRRIWGSGEARLHEAARARDGGMANCRRYYQDFPDCRR